MDVKTEPEWYDQWNLPRQAPAFTLGFRAGAAMAM